MQDLNEDDVRAEMQRRLEVRAAAAAAAIGRDVAPGTLDMLNPQALETLRREAEETLRGERAENE